MIAYDLEIERCIPSVYRDKEISDGYEYCEGWNDYIGMGIACICTFDLEKRIPRIFLKDNFRDFEVYSWGKQLVGFNSNPFDDNVLNAHSKIQHKSHDLLSALREAAGEPAQYTQGLTRGSRRLGGLAGVNGVPYYGDGRIVDAPRMWQDRHYGTVIDYCMRDVMMLVGLLDLVRSQGFLIDSATGEKVTLPAPFFVS